MSTWCSSTATTITRSSRSCKVATDLLSPITVGHPLRDLFDDQPNARIHTTDVTSVDLDKHEVGFAEMAPLTYDYLVLALGAEVNYFGVVGAAEHAFPLYTLADAVRLKEALLERWEAADKDPSLIEDGALNVVIVGGGPTGVESAGAIAELYRALFVKDYPDIPQEKAEILLVEAGPEIFTMFKPSLRAYAKKALAGRDVQVQVGEVVESVTPTRVTLKSRRVIPAHTLVWGAGLQANPVVRLLGLELQRGKPYSRGPDLSIAGHPEVFAVGISPGSLTPRQTRSCLSSDRSRSSPDITRARTSPGSSKARKPSRSSTSTRARWRPSAAVPQSCRGRTGER